MWRFELAKRSHEEFAGLGRGKKVSWIEWDKLLIGSRKLGGYVQDGVPYLYVE